MRHLELHSGFLSRYSFVFLLAHGAGFFPRIGVCWWDAIIDFVNLIKTKAFEKREMVWTLFSQGYRLLCTLLAGCFL